MAEVVAIVLAAGQGKRMRSKTAKQFMELGGKPLLYYSLRAMEQSGVNRIVLVTGENQIPYCEELVEKYDLKKVHKIVAGGKERYHSVYAGLQAAAPCDIVLIHDGARPFVTQEMITASIQNAEKTGACIVAVPVKDTIKVVAENGIATATPNRSELYQVQTPQTFRYEEIKKAYDEMMKKEDNHITDDAMVMEQYGGKQVYVIPGDYRNIKITTPEDMVIANAYLKN
mgnify:FL=1